MVLFYNLTIHMFSIKIEDEREAPEKPSFNKKNVVYTNFNTSKEV